MGKTTLAVQLLLQLLATRAVGQSRAEEEAVPVLLPISDWNTSVHPKLQDWLANRLEEDYPALKAPELGLGAAAALVGAGHILPILDGLDEVDEAHRVRLLTALNASLSERDPLILTSRRHELETTIEQAGQPLLGAAVIVPAALTPRQAADYLRACLSDPPPPAWERVLHALTGGTAPGLSELAATPLGLWLIRTVYLVPGADPSPLADSLGGDVVALRIHLLERLIPAMHQARKPSTDPADHFRPRHRWTPEATRRYLTYLAHAFPPAETRDITWWRIAGTVSHIRASIGLASGLVVGLIALLLVDVAGIWVVFETAYETAYRYLYETAYETAAGSVKPGVELEVVRGVAHDVADKLAREFALETALESTLTVGLLIALRIGAVIGLVVGLVVGFVLANSWVKQTPGFADLHLRGRTTQLLHIFRNKLGLGSWLGIGLGVAAMIDNGGLAALTANGLMGLIAGTLIPGLIAWTEQPTVTSISTPRSSWRADRALALLRILVVTFLGGLTLWIAGSTWGWGVIGIAFGAIGGLAFGLIAGRHHAWLACTVAVVRLAAARRLPWRIMGFLEDAHRLGLLRAVGPIYQFRHAALHDHLADPATEYGSTAAERSTSTTESRD